MAEYTEYEARMNAYGNAYRVSKLNRSKEQLGRAFYKNPSVREVIVGDETRELMITSTDKPEVKNVISPPNETFSIGKYVIFQDKDWIISSVDEDDNVYKRGKMTLCPTHYKIQDGQGRVFCYPYFVKNSTISFDEGQFVVSPVGTRKIILPFDDVTSLLSRDKRLMGTVINGIPQCWKITEIDADSTIGILEIAMKYDPYNPETDSIDRRICDYVPTSDYDTVPPAKDSRVEIVYRGSNTVKVGGSPKTFTADYYTASGIKESGVGTIWTVVTSIPNKKFSVDSIEADDGSVSFKLSVANDSSLVGSNIKVIATEDIGSNARTSEILIEVVNAL